MSELERARARKSNKKITVDDKLELVSFPCPVLLSKGGFTIVFIHLFPLTCPLKLTIITVTELSSVFLEQGDASTSKLKTVVTVAFKSENDMGIWNELMENEREALKNKVF